MSQIIKMLDKMLKEEKKIAGYSIKGNVVKVYVEDEEMAKQLYDVKVEGYTVQIVVLGKFEAL